MATCGKRSRSIQPRHGESNRCERHEKTQKSNRKWEEMDHEILICIMKRYPWYEWHQSKNADFIICKSWLSAFLDVLFPPGDVLDLRILDDHQKFGCAESHYRGRYSPYAWKIRMFYRYLKLNLDRRPSNYYTKLILSECILHSQAYMDIAQRLPALKSFVSPVKMSSCHELFNSSMFAGSCSFVSSATLRHCQNLEVAHCPIDMSWDLAGWCKSLRDLTFVGMIGRGPGPGPFVQDSMAVVIAKSFPLLERLSFTSHVFTFAGMSMILDGHKNLSCLDMKHSICVAQDGIGRRSYRTSLDCQWPKDKITRVKAFLTCEGKNCPDCGHLYLSLPFWVNSHFHFDL
ncbi:hypothetical protein RND81_06G245100 [Saponaria officinalis]|uniref:Uncharacterized protein n=1 Tax=Saponaria officinalis TaxID=3572 RepID=A0AAW1KAF9_SAPOF